MKIILLWKSDFGFAICRIHSSLKEKGVGYYNLFKYLLFDVNYMKKNCVPSISLTYNISRMWFNHMCIQPGDTDCLSLYHWIKHSTWLHYSQSENPLHNWYAIINNINIICYKTCLCDIKIYFCSFISLINFCIVNIYICIISQQVA